MYNIDQNAARQGDERGGRITDIGRYVGKFTRAEHVISDAKKTTGVEFAFESDDKQSATFTVWTINGKGEQIFGFKQLQAIMTVLKCRSLATTVKVVKKWDRNSQGIVNVEAEVFADLMDKPVGVLFETEDYEKYENGQPSGKVGTKLVFAGVFDPKTNLTASEILDKKVQPQKLEQNIRTLRHRPLKRVAGNGGTPAYSGHPNAPGNDAGGGYDDDIPFGPLHTRAAWSAI
jgi:hypothetical protein